MPKLDLGHSGNLYEIDDTQARYVVESLRSGRPVELDTLQHGQPVKLFVSPTNHVAIQHPPK